MAISPDENNLPPDWRIRDIEIDTVRAQVRRAGKPIALDQNSFRVLLHLAEHAARDVAKEELLRAGWPGRVVSDNSLAKAIGKLRQSLGDEGAELIRVVHGHGYRLAATVERLERTPAPGVEIPNALVHTAPATPSMPFRRWPALAVLALLAVTALWFTVHWNENRAASVATTLRPNTGEDVVAVLPFRSLAPGDTLALFADGVGNHLRDKLQGVPKMRPISRAESVTYAEDPREPAVIARELGANLIVSGTVTMAGERLVVQLNLVDTKGNIPALHQTFERAPANQATLLDDLTAALLDGIAQRPGGYDPAGGGTTNPAAYRAFLRAATLFAGNSDTNIQRRALNALEQALQLDPNYADAWFMLADILGGGGYWADSVEELVEGRKRALVAMDRGLALAPNDPYDYLVRSELRLLYFYDWKGASEDIETAKRLTPNGESAMLLIWKARYLASAGRIDEAIAADSRAIALDPVTGARRNQGWHYLAKRDTRNARAILMLALPDLPESAHINFYLALCDILDDQPQAALSRLEHSSTLFRLVGTAIAEHELGNHAASNVALQKLTDQFAIPDGYWIGAVHAWRGETDEAFHWLQRAMHHGDNNVMYIPFDPLLENLRGDPRYAALLQELKLPE